MDEQEAEQVLFDMIGAGLPPAKSWSDGYRFALDYLGSQPKATKRQQDSEFTF